MPANAQVESQEGIKLEIDGPLEFLWETGPVQSSTAAVSGHTQWHSCRLCMELDDVTCDFEQASTTFAVLCTP